MPSVDIKPTSVLPVPNKTNVLSILIIASGPAFIIGNGFTITSTVSVVAQLIFTAVTV